jgi:predicted nucleotidyltransferase
MSNLGFEVLFHPEARLELAQAMEYYRAISPTLSREFYEAFKTVIQDLTEFPEASRNQEDKKVIFVFTTKTLPEQRQEILAFLQAKLEPHPQVHALWLEGADARDRVDEFSDLDLWFDVEDGQEEIVLKQIEQYLNELAPLDMVYKKPDFHPQIKQCFFHLTNTSEFLIIDVCIQSHSREFEFGPSDPVKVIFDKSNIIRFQQNVEKIDVLEQAKAIQSEVMLYRVWVLKALKRGYWLEAISYYHERILEPLARVLRLHYTPEKAEYGFKHFDQDLPNDVIVELKMLIHIDSSERLESNLNKAVEWLNETVKALGKL